EAAMKIIMGKEILVDRNGVQETIKLPVDFINSASKRKKTKLLMPRMPFVVGGFTDDSPNKDVLQPKDFVTAVNGQKISYFDQMDYVIKQFTNKEVTAKINRDNKEIDVILKINAERMIGVRPALIKHNNAETLGLYKFSTD